MEELPRYEKTSSGRVIDRGKYLFTDKKTGKQYRVRYIGVHHAVRGIFFGGVVSSYQGKFEDDDIVILQNGLDDVRKTKLGNVKEAYEIFKEVLLNRRPKTFFEKCECVMETINRYFGDYSNIKSRLSFYPTEDEEKDDGEVANLAHQNAAICVERSMLAQNLLKELGINSTYKAGGFINNDGLNDAHAFNVVVDDDKYFIFDSTQPTLRDGIISPIVAEIPKDVYEAIIEPRNDDGISVRVSHYNPMTDKDYDVIYDANWDRLYDARGSLDKDKTI